MMLSLLAYCVDGSIFDSSTVSEFQQVAEPVVPNSMAETPFYAASEIVN